MPRRERKPVLKKQSREFVVLLRDYFEREQQNGGPLLPLTRIVDTKLQQPSKDLDSITLNFKEDFDDNIVLVVHSTIDDHHPLYSIS